MKPKIIQNAIDDSLTVERDGYDYKLFPFGENGTYISADLVQVIGEKLLAVATQYRGSFELICAIAPGGNPWGLLLARDLNCDLTVLRGDLTNGGGAVPRFKKKDEPVAKIYFPEALRNKRVLLVDDVISTGTTSVDFFELLRNNGVRIVAFIAIYSKGSGADVMASETGVPIHILAND